MDETIKEKLQEIKFGYLVTDVPLKYLLLEDSEGITYLEYLLKGKPPKNLLEQTFNEIATNPKAIYICIKSNYYVFDLNIKNEDILFEKIEDDKNLIDIILKGNYPLYYYIFNSIKNRVEFIDYIIKYSNDSLLRNLSYELIDNLFTNKNGIYPIDKYIDNNIIIKMIIQKVSIEKLINYCKNKNDFYLLSYVNQNNLLYVMDNGKKVYEFLLDNNIDPLFFNFDIDSKEILDELVKRGKIDLLYNAKAKSLLSNYDENRTYFDLMVEEHKKGKNVNFEKKNYNENNEQCARLLIKMAENDVLGFVPRIDSNFLLNNYGFNDKSILEYLLEFDKNITLSKIINKKCLEDFKFVLELKRLGVDEYLPKVNLNNHSFSEEILNKYNSKYSKESVSIYEGLLNELKILFMSDGISDKKIIELLIDSYRFLTTKENEDMLLEIKQLIEIKKHYPDKFVYKNTDKCSYFSISDGAVYINRNIIGCINHETSHALHYYLANNYVPENYYEKIEKVRNDKEKTEKIIDFCKKIYNLKREISSKVSKSKISDYYDSKYVGEKRDNLLELLSQTKEEKKKKFEKNYPDDVLDVILDDTFTIDEYIKQEKEIEESEVTTIMLCYEYDAYISMVDIMDAIFIGKFYNGVVIDKKGDYVPKMCGHGIDYYMDSRHGFDEMIAEFGEIIKFEHSNKYIDELRQLIGNEIVDMIEDVYKNKILRSSLFDENIIDNEENNNYGR